MCFAHMRNTITALERIFPWRRTLPIPDPSSGSEAFYRSRSSADSTIIMSESNFRQRQGLDKSRLLAAAREMIAADDPQIVTYFCSQNFTNTALYPVIGQME